MVKQPRDVLPSFRLWVWCPTNCCEASYLHQSRPRVVGELVAILTVHNNLPPSEVTQQFWFKSRSKKTAESIAAYVAELRHLAEFCKHGVPWTKCSETLTPSPGTRSKRPTSQSVQQVDEDQIPTQRIPCQS